MNRHPKPALMIAAIVMMLTAACVGWGCARKKQETVAVLPESSRAGMTEAGPFRLDVRNRPETPTVGDNTVLIALPDTLGRPVQGAHVETAIVMEAMGAMPRMESRGVVKEASPGRYEASYGIPMAGEWDLHLRIRHESGAAEAEYRLSTSLKGVAFTGGTPPARGQTSVASGVAADESGAVRVDPARRQAIGVRTEPAQIRDLATTIRAAGRVTYDETRRSEVSLKFAGWVRDIRVDYTGKPVQAGQVLFTVYSPE